MAKHYSAIANHVFGGGMLIGFKRAGLQVKADLETFDIGVKTLTFNYPDVELRQDSDAKSWRVNDFDGVDVVFGNPRCTAFSTLTVGLGHRHGSGGVATIDIRQSFGIVKACRPQVFCLESVQGAAKTGWPLLQKMASELPDEYRFAIVFVNNATFGVSQNRKRLFIIGYRGCQYGPPPPVRPDHVVLTKDVIHDLRNVEAGNWKGKECNLFHFVEHNGTPLANHYVFNGITPETCDYNCRLIVPGTCIYDLDPRKAEKTLRQKREAGIGLSFHCIRRAWYDGVAPLIYSASANWLHPEFHRSITVREAARMMGIPDDYWYLGHSMYAQVGNGVAPNTAEWIASTLVEAINGEHDDVQYKWNPKKNDVEAVPGNNERWKFFEFTKLTPRDLKEVDQRRRQHVREIAAWQKTNYGKRIKEAIVRRAKERKAKKQHGLLGGGAKESQFKEDEGLSQI